MGAHVSAQQAAYVCAKVEDPAPYLLDHPWRELHEELKLSVE